jgi:hypothetical protein
LSHSSEDIGPELGLLAPVLAPSLSDKMVGRLVHLLGFPLVISKMRRTLTEMMGVGRS